MADGTAVERRFSSSDLAAIVGVTKRAVEQRANRECWRYVSETGRGGQRRLYSLSALPAELQAAVLLRERRASQPAVPKSGARWTDARIASAWERYRRASAGAQSAAQQRLQSLQAIEILVGNGMGLMQARAMVIAQLRSEGARGCSDATLALWQAKVKGAPRDAWLALLLPAHVGRTAVADDHPQAWDWYCAQWLSRSRPTHSDTYSRLKLIAQTEGWTIASAKTYQRRCEKRLDPYTILFYREGAQAAAKLLPPQTRDPLCFAAGEAVNGDGLKFDRLWVRFADGEILNTATAWFWQDIRTRKILAWRLGKTENTDIFRLATYDLTAVCAPTDVWMDNTRVAANKLMTAGAEGRHRYRDQSDDGLGLLLMLGMTPHFTNPDKEMGSPGAKPIERAFGKGGIHEKVATHPSLRDRGYSKATAITAEELHAILIEEVARHNAETGRRTAACGGVLSFEQAWVQGIGERPPRVLSPAQRNLLLMCRELVTVDQRSGGVALKAGRSAHGVNRYRADGLERYMGRKLMAHFDPDDLSSGIHLYTLDGRYVMAAEHQPTSAFNSLEDGRHHQKLKARLLKSHKATAATQKRMDDHASAAIYSSAKKPAESSPAAAVGNVVSGHFARVPNPERDAVQAQKTGTDDGLTSADHFILDLMRKQREDAL